MNRNFILCARELCVTQMNHWTAFSLVLLLFGLTQNVSECEEPSVWIWLAMSALPFAFYFLRLYLHRFLLLLGGHLVLLAVSFVLLSHRDSPARTIYFLSAVLYAAYSIALRLRGGEFLDGKVIMPAAVGIFAGATYLLHYLGCGKWDSAYLLALIAVFGLYFLTCYLESYLRFLVVNDSSTGHIPEREIFVSGARLMIGFVLSAMLLLLLCSHFEWLGAVAAFLRAAVFSLVRLLIGILPRGGPDAPAQEAPLVPGGGGTPLPEAGETALIWIVLEYIALAAFFCGLVWLALRLMVWLFRFVRERMNRKRSGLHSHTWERVRDVREKCPYEKPSRKAQRPLFARATPRDRIRRLYRNHVKAAVSGLSPKDWGETPQDPAFRTAREWGKILGEEAVSPLYEKARYSDENISAEEVRLMRELVSGRRPKNSALPQAGGTERLRHE